MFNVLKYNVIASNILLNVIDLSITTIALVRILAYFEASSIGKIIRIPNHNFIKFLR